MNKKFEIEKSEQRLKFAKIMSVGLVIVGVITLLAEDYSDFKDFRSIGRFLDNSLFFILGLVVFVTSSRRLSKIAGSYVLFENEGFSFKSRQIEKKFERVSDIKTIEIKLKTIEICDTNNNHFIIYIDDCNQYSDKKDIKENFRRIKKIL